MDAEWLGDGDEDDFAEPGSKRKRKTKKGARKKSKRMSPLDAKYKMFPSLNTEQYPRHIESNFKRWLKSIRVGKLLKRCTGSMKNVASEFKVSGVQAAKFPHWTGQDDLHLVLGACRHGVGAWT
eukprot:UN24905